MSPMGYISEAEATHTHMMQRSPTRPFTRPNIPFRPHNPAPKHTQEGRVTLGLPLGLTPGERGAYVVGTLNNAL